MRAGVWNCVSLVISKHGDEMDGGADDAALAGMLAGLRQEL